VQGVVSILDAAHNTQVESLWKALEEQFSLQYACVAYPHFTYHLAESYKLYRVSRVLRRLAKEAIPFQITTSGIGLFTGERPVLYLPVVCDLALTRFHDKLWKAVTPCGSGVHTHHYGPQNWVPHITLAVQDLTHDILPDVIRLLSSRTFNWTCTITSLSLVLDARGGREDWIEFPFGEPPE
jgi:2'-5' RNA ligase